MSYKSLLVDVIIPVFVFLITRYDTFDFLELGALSSGGY
jgi:hypothetical protein